MALSVIYLTLGCDHAAKDPQWTRKRDPQAAHTCVARIGSGSLVG
jgi:hypothetical protein